MFKKKNKKTEEKIEKAEITNNDADKNKEALSEEGLDNNETDDKDSNKSEEKLNGLESMGIQGVSWDELDGLKDEEDSIEETKKRKILLVVIVDLLLIAIIAVISIIVIKKYEIKNTREALEVLPIFSRDKIVENASMEMIDSYVFLLNGSHRAPCEKTESGTASFKFKADGKFIGFNGIYENAEGSYEVKAENGLYIVYIYTDGMTNKYSLTIDENNIMKLEGVNDATPWTFIFID